MKYELQFAANGPRHFALRAAYCKPGWESFGISDLMTGTVQIQKSGTKYVCGLPFKHAWDSCGAGKHSWQNLQKTMTRLTVEDLTEMGGYFCVLEPDTFLVSPPGMILWELAVGDAVSLTISYEFLAQRHCQERFSYNMLTVVNNAASLCTEPHHMNLEKKLRVSRTYSWFWKCTVH